MYFIGQEELDALKRVIDSKELFKINNANQEVYHAEEDFKKKLGKDYALLMSSGEAALISSLIGIGVGPGDEVIVPGYTYIATAMAVVAVGAIPVICEVDDTLTIDIEDCEKKISKYTKAIMPVHMQGMPCNMDALMALAKKYNLPVIEDSCQALGSKYHGQYLGTFGDAGCISFNYFKIITAGEGGMLVTSNRQLYERALIYHDSSAIAFFGTQLDNVTEPQFGGVEYRVGEFTGALVRTQLQRLDGIVALLQERRNYLAEALKNDFEFARSNDIAGDCGMNLVVRFNTAEKADAFGKKVMATVPINTGKHVYCNWTPIMNKRGAFHPLMDPYLMPVNANLNHNYSYNMCPNTLDILSRTAYVGINPCWTEEDLENKVKELKAAK